MKTDGIDMLAFSSPHYVADLPRGHVFPMRKFSWSATWIDRCGLGCVVEPGRVSREALHRVHTPDYVRSIETGEYNPLTALRLGLPWHPTIHRRAMHATMGTIAAAHAALRDGIACNLAGGTHHAFPDRGEGFCVFNDVAVAIRELQSIEPWLQVMVIDLDAHQGNGTHAIFRGDANVMTYSAHVGRNYPSRKEPGTLDIELSRMASTDEFFSRVEPTMIESIELFEPDLVFYIAGADVHEDDRFGQMKLSSRAMRERDRMVMRYVRGWGIPCAVVYGGGYNRQQGMTAWLHTQAVWCAAERWCIERGLTVPDLPDLTMLVQMTSDDDPADDVETAQPQALPATA